MLIDKKRKIFSKRSRVFFVMSILLLGFLKAKAASAPQTPTNLQATAVSDTEINLTWQRVGTDETSITVWRQVSGSFVKVKTLPARSNIFTDTSLYPATQYSYEITADNDQGSSQPSTIVSATTKASGATAAAATNFSAVADSPYSVKLTWNDSNTVSRSWFLERSTDSISYSVVEVISSSSASVSYEDTPLESATTYYYRTRLVAGGGYSDYSAPVSVTTQTAAANVPSEPTNLTATVNSATSTTLNWTDSNNGQTTYLVETAPFVWSPTLPTWTQVTETQAGATSYNLITTAEKFYFIRVRAKNSNGNSGYSQTIKIRTASPGTGSAKTYEIGPGKQYASLGALNWSSLGPGDTVNIYPNRDANGNIIPYYEKPMISVRGTASAQITIQGIPDTSSGQLPSIDGTSAVENNQWNRSYLPIHDLALVLISYRQNQTDSGWSPGYFTLSNLEIRNGYNGDSANLTYTAFDGTTRTYAKACGIYIEKGDHITIKNNIIDGNNEGIFAAGQGDQRNLENITLDSNYFFGNGTINSNLQHQTYIEGINDVYQFNKYGSLRATALGSGLKDRGAGTIIRYNRFEDGGHHIDLVEAENYQSVLPTLDSYYQTYVYGNIFYNQDSATPIHYGGDGGVAPAYRKGILYFYNNTFVNVADQSLMWRINILKLETSGESLDARDNIFAFFPLNTKTIPEIDLLSDVGVAYFGRNWINSTWVTNRIGDTFTGHIAGSANLINNAQNDPGFIAYQNKNFHLTATSQNIDKEDDLPANVPVPTSEYVEPYGSSARNVLGVMDLGAYEYSGNKTYSFLDFSNLFSNWFKSNAQSDLNGDGRVNAKDLGIMMSNWN